jgi:hypothetical protein
VQEKTNPMEKRFFLERLEEQKGMSAVPEKRSEARALSKRRIVSRWEMNRKSP